MTGNSVSVESVVGRRPRRVQLRRSKGWRMPPNTVKVDRSTKFGNPFVVFKNRSQDESVAEFRKWLAPGSCNANLPRMKSAIISALPKLCGKNLACWCPLDAPCHADVLLVMANAGAHRPAREAGGSECCALLGGKGE